MDKEAKNLNQKSEAITASPGKTKKISQSISYKLLGELAFTFVLGVGVTLIIQNVLKSESVQFSTISLLGFIFSIALVGASIVLAITAISLGKASEQAMIARSDESIRLQNEIFLKTTEALIRIESSTGVTEKRLEDIISGRAGIISEKAVQAAIDEDLIRPKTREALKGEIKRSIIDEFLQTRGEPMPQEMMKSREERREARKKYIQFKDQTLLKIANNTDLIAKKIGDGNIRGYGEDMVDGVFVFKDRRIGIAAFSVSNIVHPFIPDDFSDYIRRFYHEIDKGTFQKGFIVFDEKLPEEEKHIVAFQECKHLIRKEIAEDLYVFSGSLDEIFQEILKTLN